MRDIAARLPLYDVVTLEERLRRQVAPQRFGVFLISLFAAVSLVLALTGLYGLVSYAARQRRREIGIRLALGARRGDILWMILRWGGMRTLAGVVLGLVLSFGVLPRMLARLHYPVETTAPLVLAAILLLLLAGGLASLLPALQATRVAPASSLGAE